MAEMAAILAGGIAAGIYPTDTAAQVTYKAEHSGSVVACVESAAKAKAFITNAATLKKLKAVVVWDPEATVESLKGLAGSSGIKVKPCVGVGSRGNREKTCKRRRVKKKLPVSNSPSPTNQPTNHLIPLHYLKGLPLV